MQPTDLFLAVIQLNFGNERLTFGPFTSYTEANDFAQAKFHEYACGKCAYVETLLPAILFPSRRV